MIDAPIRQIRLDEPGDRPVDAAAAADGGIVAPPSSASRKRARWRRSRWLLLVLGLLFSWTVPAYAAWSGSAVTAASFASATLQPPTDVAIASIVCAGGNAQADVTVSWTPSTSTFAEGYRVTRYRNGALDAGPTTVTPGTASSITQNVRLRPVNTEYRWDVETFAGSWTSTVASVSHTVTPPPPC